MEQIILDRLTTLGHPQRMAVFRLLMRRYPQRVPAGALAQALSIKPSTLSVYLSALKGAGLVEQTPKGVSRLYQVRLSAAREIMDYLFLDCCRGRTELCPPLTTPQTGYIPRALREKPNVIFICTGNSARSIMAESILRHEANIDFNAYSAGTRPRGAPHALALELLKTQGHDIAPLRSKNLSEFQTENAPAMDFVFTVCDHAANEECPLWPGRPINGHWGVPDPAAVTGTPAQERRAFAKAFDRLQARIREFVALPLEKLDKAALQNHIDEIGQAPVGEQE